MSDFAGQVDDSVRRRAVPIALVALLIGLAVGLPRSDAAGIARGSEASVPPRTAQQAQPPALAKFSIDLDPGDNSFGAVGDIERCRTQRDVFEFNVTIDVVLQAIPHDVAVVRYRLNYPRGAVELLSKSVVAPMSDDSEPIPDLDGSYQTVLSRPSPGVPFGGDGALVRYTFRLHEGGFWNLDLSNLGLVRWQGDDLQPVPVDDAHYGRIARLAVKRSCGIVIVPGIMGSTLFDRSRNSSVWAPSVFQLSQLNRLVPTLERIKFAADGHSPPRALTPTPDIVANGVFSYYDDLSKSLVRDLGYKKATLHYDPRTGGCSLSEQPDPAKFTPNLFLFPYDWRHDLRRSSLALEACMRQLKDETTLDGDKFVHKRTAFVAHSMGGLVTRHWAVARGHAGEIDRVIFLGTPHVGSVDMYLAVAFGQAVIEQREYAFLLDVVVPSVGQTARTLIKNLLANFPSAYQVLPNQAYINRIGSFVRVNGNLRRTLANTYVTFPGNVPNIRLWNTNAVAFWSEMQAWNDLGRVDADIWVLRGIQQGTSSSVALTTRGRVRGRPKFLVEVPATSGDQRVVPDSANAVRAAPGKTFVEVTQQVIHGLMPSDRGVQRCVQFIIRRIDCDDGAGPVHTVFTESLMEFISDPVRLEVVDRRGRKIAPVGSRTRVAIPGASHSRAGETELVRIPTTGTYRIVLTTIGRRGSFTLALRRVRGTATRRVFYVVERMSRNGRAILNYNARRSRFPAMKLDANGDRKFERRVMPRKTLKRPERRS